MILKNPCGFLLVFVLFCASAAAASPPKKVYVPNPTGDVSEKLGAVIASEISAALMKRSIKAFTYANLKDQLKQEEYKEVLQCKAEDRCVAEVVAGFGCATRVFTQVTKLGTNSYHLELSLETKGVFEKKVTDTVSCKEGELGPTTAHLALRLVGLPPPPPHPTPPAPPWPPPEGRQEFTVTFESEPTGAQVEIDGVPMGQTPCGLYVAEGAHTLRMSLSRYLPQTDTVVVSAEQTVRWQLQPAFGWLNVTTDPAGVPVLVKRKGRKESQTMATPSGRVEFDPGDYVIDVADDHYHSRPEHVRVTMGKEQNVVVEAREKLGYVKVRVRDELGNAVGATVSADGADLGRSPGPWPLRVGRHEIEAVADGFVPQTAVVEVENGATVETTVVLSSNPRLVVDCVPEGAAVWINGNKVGASPMAYDCPGPGSYEVKCVLDGVSVSESFRLAAGDRKRFAGSIDVRKAELRNKQEAKDRTIGDLRRGGFEFGPIRLLVIGYGTEQGLLIWPEGWNLNLGGTLFVLPVGLTAEYLGATPWTLFRLAGTIALTPSNFVVSDHAPVAGSGIGVSGYVMGGIRLWPHSRLRLDGFLEAHAALGNFFDAGDQYEEDHSMVSLLYGADLTVEIGGPAGGRRRSSGRPVLELCAGVRRSHLTQWFTFDTNPGGDYSYSDDWENVEKSFRSPPMYGGQARLVLDTDWMLSLATGLYVGKGGYYNVPINLYFWWR